MCHVLVLLCLTAVGFGLGEALTVSKPNHANALQGSKNYTLYTDVKVNWHEAYKYCDKLDLNLASFNSEQEYEQLVKQIKDEPTCSHSGGFWTAGYVVQGGGVRWLTSRRTLQFAPWYHGQPTLDKRVRLVSLRPDYHYKLMAELMSSHNYVACEKRLIDMI